MEPDAVQQNSQEGVKQEEEEDEEDETDPTVLAKKQKQLARRGVTFEAKVDPKVHTKQACFVSYNRRKYPTAADFRQLSHMLAFTFQELHAENSLGLKQQETICSELRLWLLLTKPIATTHAPACHAVLRFVMRLGKFGSFAAADEAWQWQHVLTFDQQYSHSMDGTA